jgi:uncharacterized membrane protein
MLWIIFKREWLKNMSLALLALGVTFAFLAVLSGDAAEEMAETIPGIEQAIEAHENLAKLTTGLFLATLTIKLVLLLFKRYNTRTNLIPMIIAVIGLYLLFQTGLKGGELVYKYGAGVQKVIEYEETDDFD